MASKVKNITFSLPIELIEKYKQYAKDKYIPSLNAGVREALEEYSTKIEKEMLKREIKEASNDKMFMEDLKESMDSFLSSDADLFKGEQEW